MVVSASAIADDVSPMRVVTSEMMRSHLDLVGLMDFMEARHREPKGEIADSLLGEAGARYLVRSATGSRVYGTKLVTIFPGHATQNRPSVQAVFVIFDRSTGSPVAAMEATELTYWKTAADSGLGSRFLSRQNSRVLLICGAGALAPWLIRAHKAARLSLEKILVWNRTRDKAETLALSLASEGFDISVADDLAETVSQSDIISTATMASTPFLKGEWLKPGQHLDLVGGYSPDTREADDICVKRADVFVDSRKSALDGVGDIIHPIASGALKEADICGDLYDLANGTGTGRKSAFSITVFKNAGGAHLDLMTAEFLLSRIQD